MVGHSATKRLSAVPLREVAGGVPAIIWLSREIVIVVDVALRAGSCRMSPGQRKACDGVVEGTDIRPGSSVVARRAVGHCEDRTRRRMRGIVGLLPGSQVAASVTTIRRSNLQVVVVIGMAA